MDKWLNQQPLKRKSSSLVATVSTETIQTGAGARADSDSDEDKQQLRKIRRYDKNYLSFGFSWCGEEKEPKPQCVICNEKLSNHSMKPSLLQRHFNTKHALFKDKPLEFFIRRKMELKRCKNTLKSFIAGNSQALEASYLVSLRIAQTGKPHTIGESLILPAAKDIVSSVLGPNAAKKLDVVPLSDNTVSRRIHDLAADVKTILIQRIKLSKFFAIQLDESTDVTNFAQLMVYVRYEFKQSVEEEFLCCESLSGRTTAAEIFKKVDDFITSNEINWQNCVGVCSDGAAAMTGKHGGVVTKIKQVAPEAKFTHCSIHREALATKAMPTSLKAVLDKSVKVVNFIKTRAINSRMFSILCNEMGSDHKKLLLHTDVRWLSRGKVLSRLFELRAEVQIFAMDNKFDDAELFLNELWLMRLAYLADLFGKLNELNSSLQGRNVTPFVVADKLNAVVKKLQFMVSDAEQFKITSFQSLHTFLTENDLQLNPDLVDDIKNHCSQLILNFRSYFPEQFDDKSWIRNPFADVELPADFSAQERDQFIELSCDGGLKSEFNKDLLSDFWLKRRGEYGLISDRALKFLIPFSTSYLCETGFSAMLGIKNKYRSKLELEPDLRLKLTNVKPDIAKLCNSKQAHSSH